jgi:DNA repair exonuclease SbcCD ATPase subunit
MAEAALGLLSEHCPVCTQSIDEQHVREHLQRLVGGDDDDAADLEAARERVSASRAALDQAESAARRAAAARTAREQAAARWTQALAGAPLVDVPREWHGLDSLEEAQSALQSAREELQAAYRELAALEHDPALAGLTAQLAELKAAQAESREKAEGAARRAQEADGLRKAATASAVEITEQSLTALEPAFAEVYDRLAPHPSFTHLRMVHETYYGKGRSAPRIFDPVRGIEANPNLVCSEGQLNIVALSYFLALNLETEQGGLPFAILDDPLQAMDVINVLGFCDVARALRERRQLILTTHDRRFAALLERKLTPRQEGQRTLHLEFSAWDRSGPHIEVGRPALEQVPSLLDAA